jgi:ABC-type amino acid transport substrate-binding protein
MKLVHALAVLCLAPVVALAQSSAALDGHLKKIKDSKTINVAYRTDATPFAFVEGDSGPTGYSVDLCKRVVGSIEQQLGVTGLKVNWVPVTVNSRFEGLIKGSTDMECGASSVTLSRLKTVDFSSFIFVDGTGLLTKTTQGANTLGDLAGKKIGVIAGTSNERALNDAMKRRVMTATIVNIKSREDGLQQLEDGTIDAMASDRFLLMGLSGKAKDPKSMVVLTDALSFEPYAIALPRGDWQMRLAVNTALSQIYRSTAITEIYGRWFGALGQPGPLVEHLFLFGMLPD